MVIKIPKVFVKIFLFIFAIIIYVCRISTWSPPCLSENIHEPLRYLGRIYPRWHRRLAGRGQVLRGLPDRIHGTPFLRRAAGVSGLFVENTIAQFAEKGNLQCGDLHRAHNCVIVSKKERLPFRSQRRCAHGTDRYALV